MIFSRNKGAALLHGLLLVFVLSCPSRTEALYSIGTEPDRLDVTGFFGAGGAAARYPGTDILYPERSQTSWYTDLRLIGDARVGDAFGAKVNILQNVQHTPIISFAGNDSFSRDVERSGVLYWQQHESVNSQAAMVLDSAYLKYGNRDNELTVGRQPISTSVTFFFTPNDFFAPFSANTFFRVYKPGVDAVRYERRIAALSQLSMIGVLGYEPEPGRESGWSGTPDWQAGSMLARMTYTAGLAEWGGICGIVREALVTGLSFQGEFFQWLGVRAEGHYADSWGQRSESGLQMTIGLEHRFSARMVMRMEQMYNGFGASDIAEFLAETTFPAATARYAGRHYSAFDINYEITPLLVGEMLYLRNWTDDSSLLSVYGVYSVSDESELAFTASFPGGAEPEQGKIRSEMGSLPVQFLLEFRVYF